MTEVRLELNQLRESIDARDLELVRVLASRFELTRRVGELKAEHDLPPKDPIREAEHLAYLRRIAEETRLDPEFVTAIFNAVMAQAVREHQQLRQQSDFKAEV
ncbi:MAG: chorismate mutase [Propionibacteriaceae bacterium]|jgi:chorismate mutase|nr:chorismate mutase [Propionibacteriaceae bacterium]